MLTCSGLQTVSDGLANNVAFEPTHAANMRGLEPTLTENELRFIATSPQTAMWTHIQCIQHQKGLAVRNKAGPQLIWTLIVRFICHQPDICDWGKGPFLPDTEGRGNGGTARG
jgi:hypothetical protein